MFTSLALLVGLLAPKDTARITFEVEPKGAAITLDGKRIRGRVAKVKPGKYKVRVSKSGYVTGKRTITAVGGKKIKVKFRLKPKSGRTPIVGKKSPSKRPKVAKPTKRPVTKKPAKRPVTKKPRKRPAKRPVTKRPVKKRPVAKRPPSKRPAGRRPIKRRPAGAPAPVAGGGGGVSDTAGGGGRTSTKPFAILAFVVAGVAVTGGVIAGLAADDKALDFNASVDRGEKQKLKRDADNLALGANIAYGVGATAAVVGAVLWAMDDTDDGYAWQAAPLAEGGAVVGIGGVF